MICHGKFQAVLLHVGRTSAEMSAINAFLGEARGGVVLWCKVCRQFFEEPTTGKFD